MTEHCADAAEHGNHGEPASAFTHSVFQMAALVGHSGRRKAVRALC